jgi:hypothetical protein
VRPIPADWAVGGSLLGIGGACSGDWAVGGSLPDQTSFLSSSFFLSRLFFPLVFFIRSFRL